MVRTRNVRFDTKESGHSDSFNEELETRLWSSPLFPGVVRIGVEVGLGQVITK